MKVLMVLALFGCTLVFGCEKGKSQTDVGAKTNPVTKEVAVFRMPGSKAFIDEFRAKSTSDLIGSLKSEDENVRAAAIDILGERKSAKAIPELIRLLADGASLFGSDNWVGGHAANALSRITGQPFSVEQEKWQDWWSTNKAKFREH